VMTSPATSMPFCQPTAMERSFASGSRTATARACAP
jgi:hypothetical protein